MASTRPSNIVGQNHRSHGGWSAGMGALGRGRTGDAVKVVVRSWDRIKHSDITCVVLAMLFSAVFVVPPIMIFSDRSLPFQYGHTYAKTDYLHAGQIGTNVFTVKDARKNCNGEFSRFFTDAKGNRFFLGTFRTSYQHGLSVSEGRSFTKDWIVPLGAMPGPGLYEAEPRFWCNWIQGIYPIKADTVKIKVTIVP